MSWLVPAWRFPSSLKSIHSLVPIIMPSQPLGWNRRSIINGMICFRNWYAYSASEGLRWIFIMLVHSQTKGNSQIWEEMFRNLVHQQLLACELNWNARQFFLITLTTNTLCYKTNTLNCAPKVFLDVLVSHAVLYNWSRKLVWSQAFSRADLIF